jgi:hypothetical protein
MISLPYPSGLSKVRGRFGPEGGGASTPQGHPYAIFRRALKRRNVLMALAVAKELPQLSLVDALELTVLVARTDPRRHPRSRRAGFCVCSRSSPT